MAIGRAMIDRHDEISNVLLAPHTLETESSLAYAS